MTILDRAKAHYESLPRRDLAIPEWGDHAGPAVITWSELTVNDQERIYAPIDGVPVSTGTIRVRAVILKACDEKGDKLFDGMAEHELRFKVSGNIVGRLANAILYGAGLVDTKGATVPVDDQIDAVKNG